MCFEIRPSFRVGKDISRIQLQPLSEPGVGFDRADIGTHARVRYINRRSCGVDSFIPAFKVPERLLHMEIPASDREVCGHKVFIQHLVQILFRMRLPEDYDPGSKEMTVPL